MANVHAPDKEPMTIRIPRTLRVRLVREAQRLNKTLSEFVTEILIIKASTLSLSSQDYEAIRIATERAEKEGREIATVLENTARGKSRSSKGSAKKSENLE
jgi:hypothetical protein